MEENLDKKPRRPRIGASQPAPVEDGAHVVDGARYEKVEYPNRETHEGQPQEGGYQSQGYHQGGYPRRQPGSYQQRNYQGGYGYQQQYRQGGYDPYYNRPEGGVMDAAEGTSEFEGQGDYQQDGYQQGGYQRRPQQGGYQRRPQQGGYNNRQQGGYQQRQGGYNNRQQGGYQQRQGGYNNRQQGGYNNRQQGGYNNRQQGGYNNRQQGGYNNRQQGGYNNDRQPNRYNNRQQQLQGLRPQMRFTPRPKRIEYEIPTVDPESTMRLNKYMANAGVCSRREADELITRGVIRVNGEPVTELGFKVKPTDVIEFNDHTIAIEKKCYILLNKPKDCVTTVDDPHGRKTVMDLIKGACDERVYPVGRLDRNTTGVLLLTNDGDLASKLTHPQYIKKKIYQVWTDKPIAEEDMQQIADGIELDDGPIHADAVQYVNVNDRKQAGIEIHSGRNRVVRRMFERLGYHVVKLDRVYFAGLTKKNLPRGKWRYLTQEEVNFLKQNSFE